MVRDLIFKLKLTKEYKVLILIQLDGEGSKWQTKRK